MGASMSTSGGGHGHPGHDHRAGFNRVDRSNASPATCGMCQLRVDVGTVAHRCKEPGCSYLLHDACYRRPRKLKLRFAHTKHPLTLRRVDEDNLPCSICARPLAGVAYRCTSTRRSCAAAVFRAHPRCCDLPQDIVVTKGHEQDRFVLRAPAPSTTGATAGRRCLRCQTTAKTTGPRAPWSYQCLSCDDKEVCLACLLHNGRANDAVKACCNPGDVHCLGQATGVFLCGLANGMGCPGSSNVPTTTTWTWSPHNGNGDTTNNN